MAWAKTKQPGGTTKGGWGSKHQKLRKALLPQAYGKPCVRCGELMLPGQTLHLDHDDYDRTKLRGFAHALPAQLLAGIRTRFASAPTRPC